MIRSRFCATRKSKWECITPYNLNWLATGGLPKSSSHKSSHQGVADLYCSTAFLMAMLGKISSAVGGERQRGQPVDRSRCFIIFSREKVCPYFVETGSSH